MFCDNPLSALVNPRELTLFCEKLLVIVGLGEVLQQMPQADIAAPPAEVTAPPLVAELAVMADTSVVVTVGKAAGQGPQVGTP